MSSACLAIALGLATAQAPASDAQIEQANADWIARLAPRQALRGLAGFQSISAIHYAAAPDLAHELTCTYVFPARARWQIAVRARAELGRHIEYRCGAAYFELPQSAQQSVLIDPAASDVARGKCEMFELRRAAFLWPDGFEWTRAAGEASAASGCGRAFVATLDAGGRPSRFELRAVDGGVDEELRVLAWREEQPRAWPAALEYWRAGALVWSEKVESVSTRVALLDWYFLPPDRRIGASSLATQGVLHFDAPEQLEVRRALPPAADWASARDEWIAHRAQVVRQLPAGWTCLPTPLFEVEPDGRPSAVLVRLSGAGEPPALAQRSAAGPALSTAHAWPPAGLEQALGRLGAGTPTGARQSRRLVVVHGDMQTSSRVDVIAVLTRAEQ